MSATLDSARLVPGISARGRLIQWCQGHVGTLVVSAVWIATPLLAWLDPVVAPMLLLLGVGVATWCGGQGAGVGSLVVSTLALLILGRIGFGPEALWSWSATARVLAFVCVGALLCAFITTRRRAEVRRWRAELWGRLVEETAREGLWVLDLTRRTTHVNSKLARMLGYSAAKMHGINIDEFIYTPNDRVEAFFDPEQWRPGQVETLEIRFRRLDGSRMRANVSAQPILDDRREPMGLLMLVEDISLLRDALEERDQAYRALIEGERRHERLIESNVIGILTAELGGQITEANDAFLQMLGFDRSDLDRGLLRLDKMIPPEQQAVDGERIKALWASGVWPPHETELYQKDGSRIPVLLGAAALERFPRRWVGFVLDLRERKQAEEALKQAKEIAESANCAKDRFLAKLSHELRTPLTPVLATTSALLDNPNLDEEIRPVLEMIRRNIELEARLIDDLLDVTLIRHGKLKLERRVIDAHQLIQQTLEICGEELRTAGLTLEVDLSALMHHVEADPTRLQQVFWNLTKNAVKFTPSGGTVCFKTDNPRTETDGPMLRIEIRDTGVGIDPEDLGRVFDAFEQGRSAQQRRPGGMGLGLAISHSVIEQHGGRLTAQSAGRGQGTTFTIELNAVAEEPAESPYPERPPTLEDQPPLKILLVEDNKDTLRFMNLILTSKGHDVQMASNLAEALKAADHGSFDLLVSDIELPDGNGLELMRILRMERGLAIPGIALSGFGSVDDIAQSQACGFVEHLTKPIDFRALEAAIMRNVPGTSVAGGQV